MEWTAIGVAIVAVLIAALSYLESRRSRKAAERSAGSSERSAGAAEQSSGHAARSADAAEGSLDLSRQADENAERRWRQEREASLDLELGSARGGPSPHVNWALTSTGGSAAREVRVLGARVSGEEVPAYVECGDLRPGVRREGRIELPRDESLPAQILLELDIRWVDDLAPHRDWFTARLQGPARSKAPTFL